MRQFKNIAKHTFGALLFTLGLMGISGIQPSKVACAANTAADNEVSVESIDYEAGSITIDPNGNEKIYYSDAKQKTWTLLEGVAVAGGSQQMDISWIAVSKNYELTLKGDVNDTVISVDLPKYNTSLKVKFNGISNILTFTNEGGAKNFEWRKAGTTDEWASVPIDMLSKNNADAAAVADFQQKIEMLRAKGGKISVRLPQVKGDDTAAGSRPSKVVTVTIPKRANAPSVKVTANTMKVNTTTAMEYCVVDEGSGYNSETDGIWKKCEKNMPITDLSDKAATAPEVVIAIRKAETDKATYSKCAYLVIPQQDPEPGIIVIDTEEVSKTKFTLAITDASTTKPYQYAVVKAAKVADPNYTFDPSAVSWKKVTSPKAIAFASKTYPAGSVIYVRVMGKDKTKAQALQLPSDCREVPISYATE